MPCVGIFNIVTLPKNHVFLLEYGQELGHLAQFNDTCRGDTALGVVL